MEMTFFETLMYCSTITCINIFCDIYIYNMACPLKVVLSTSHIQIYTEKSVVIVIHISTDSQINYVIKDKKKMKVYVTCCSKETMEGVNDRQRNRNDRGMKCE